MWNLPPSQLQLVADEVQVWRIVLDVPEGEVHQLRQVLDPVEQARADRFRKAVHRAHFTVARGALREVLSRYVGRAPEALVFQYGPQGKPSLIKNDGGDWLRFNLTHSDGVALLAVTRATAVGIDIEPRNREVGGPEIVERFFSPREVAAFRALPVALQQEAFLNGWTRKEAFIKARGQGLTLPLDQFSVSLTPGRPAQLLEVQWDPGEIDQWALQALDAGPAYVAALVVAQPGGPVRQWQWTMPSPFLDAL